MPKRDNLRKAMNLDMDQSQRSDQRVDFNFSLDGFDFFRVFEEEKTARVNGRQWRMHKNDADKWPSDPHAIDAYGDKLDLDTGDIYSSVTRKYVGKLTKKELKAVRAILFPSDQ